MKTIGCILTEMYRRRKNCQEIIIYSFVPTFYENLLCIWGCDKEVIKDKVGPGGIIL